MNIRWSWDELAKEADCIIEVGLNDREVDETTNQLSIVCRLTLCGARVGIQFEVSIKRGCHIFALSHPELV